jgi:hypothetical protein
VSFAHAGQWAGYLPPGTYEVLDANDELVTLYSDASMGTPVGSTFSTDQFGIGSFFTVPGTYQVRSASIGTAWSKTAFTPLIPVVVGVNPLDLGGADVDAINTSVLLDQGSGIPMPTQTAANGVIPPFPVLSGALVLTGSVTSRPTVVPPGGDIWGGGVLRAYGFPATPGDALDITPFIEVSDQTATNVLTWGGTSPLFVPGGQPANPTGTLGPLDLDDAAMGAPTITGTDLTETGGIIRSTAGGIFTVTVSVTVGWD